MWSLKVVVRTCSTRVLLSACACLSVEDARVNGLVNPPSRSFHCSLTDGSAVLGWALRACLFHCRPPMAICDPGQPFLPDHLPPLPSKSPNHCHPARNSRQSGTLATPGVRPHSCCVPSCSLSSSCGLCSDYRININPCPLCLLSVHVFDFQL